MSVTVLCSEGSIFRRFYVPKVLYSEGSMFQNFGFCSLSSSDAVVDDMDEIERVGVWMGLWMTWTRSSGWGCGWGCG